MTTKTFGLPAGSAVFAVLLASITLQFHVTPSGIEVIGGIGASSHTVPAKVQEAEAVAQPNPAKTQEVVAQPKPEAVAQPTAKVQGAAAFM